MPSVTVVLGETSYVDGQAVLSYSCFELGLAVMMRWVRVANKVSRGSTGEFGSVNGTIQR